MPIIVARHPHIVSHQIFLGHHLGESYAELAELCTQGRTRNVSSPLERSPRPDDHAAVMIRDQQRERLRRTIAWARRIRSELQPVLDAHGDRVHFRPSSSGIAMVGLLPDRPQRGKGSITNLKSLAANFEALFDQHCRSVDHGRVTGEKALQSFLVVDAQTNRRRLASLNAASTQTDDPVELYFVTDEIALLVESAKTVSDILALRRDRGRSTPVVIELKDSRQLTRLVEQVDGYARLVDEHADLFAELFGAVLGEDISFDGPTEKWIVWPVVGAGPDPRTQELLERGIRVIGYAKAGDGYSFVIGPGVRPKGTITVEIRIASIDDARISSLRRLGGGEGFVTYMGEFEGRPALLVDSGTMNEFLSDEDAIADPVTVHVFETETLRDGYVQQLRAVPPAGG